MTLPDFFVVGAPKAGTTALHVVLARPAEALALIVDFLRLEPGRVTEVPAEKVTAHASGTLGNRAVSAALRVGDRVERVLPHRLWKPARDAMSRRLQREQRPRQPLTDHQREQLVPLVADDVRLLERDRAVVRRLARATGEPGPPRLGARRQDRDGAQQHRPTARPGRLPAGAGPTAPGVLRPAAAKAS